MPDSLLHALHTLFLILKKKDTWWSELLFEFYRTGNWGCFSILRVSIWVQVYESTAHESQLEFDDNIQCTSFYSVNQFLNVNHELNTCLVIRIYIQLWTREACPCLWGECGIFLLIILFPYVHLPLWDSLSKILYNWNICWLFFSYITWECLGVFGLEGDHITETLLNDCVSFNSFIYNPIILQCYYSNSIY